MNLNLAPNEAKNANQVVLSSSIATEETYSRDASQNAAEIRSSTDVLVQLRANLSQLEELHARLQFAMSEVSYLIRRD